MLVTAVQAKDIIIKMMRANLVPLLRGSPGVGKSDIYRQIADEYNLLLIDFRLSQSDPCDFLGLPNIDAVTGRGTYAAMDTFPLEGDAVPEGYTGWLLLFDEITSGKDAVQAAAYKPILDKAIGLSAIHPNVKMGAAGNLESDNAIVEEMSTALQSRLIHLELGVDVEQWLNWAAEHGIDHRACSYIRFKPDNLYTFKADHTDNTYACPRTWEFANRIIKQYDGVVDRDILPALSGALSEGVAREFVAFCRVYANLPTMEQIQATPEGIPVPNEPSVLFALTGAIASHMDDSNATHLMKFVTRLPVEFQVVTLRDVVRRKTKLRAHAAIQKWIATSATELF